jgi:hypothetical protein
VATLATAALAVLALAYVACALVVFFVLLERDPFLVSLGSAIVWPWWLAVTPVVRDTSTTERS